MINPHYHRQVEVKCNYDDRTVEIYFRRYNSRGGLGRSRLYVLEEHEPSYNRLQHLIIHHPSHTKAPRDMYESVHGRCSSWSIYEIWQDTLEERLAHF